MQIFLAAFITCLIVILYQDEIENISCRFRSVLNVNATDQKKFRESETHYSISSMTQDSKFVSQTY